MRLFSSDGFDGLATYAAGPPPLPYEPGVAGGVSSSAGEAGPLVQGIETAERMSLPPAEALLALQEVRPEQEDQQAARVEQLQALVDELHGQTVGRVAYDDIVAAVWLVVEEAADGYVIGQGLQRGTFLRSQLHGVDPVVVAAIPQRFDDLAVAGRRLQDAVAGADAVEVGQEGPDGLRRRCIEVVGLALAASVGGAHCGVHLLPPQIK